LVTTQQKIGLESLPSIRAGSVESDYFVVNDIVLRIPPDQIHIEKHAFNHEWQTLRTRNSQKVKSGHGMARVTASVIFKPQDVPLNLIKLAAGLRATPFCTVYSPYLEKMLGRPDMTSATTKLKTEYKRFRPMMLAMTSMTFSTMGHEGAPDCIRGTLDFIWFNYLPYTNLIAYKTGDSFDRPGTASQSELWKAFYAPYENGTLVPFYPHTDEAVTEFAFREFLLVPKGEPHELEALLDLVNIMRRNPKESGDALRVTLSGAERRTEEFLNNGVIGAFARDLVRRGTSTFTEDGLVEDEESKTVNEAVRAKLAKLKKIGRGRLQSLGGPLLSPIIQKIARRQAVDVDELANVERILAGRLADLKKLQSGETISFSDTDYSKFQKVTEVNGKFGTGPSSTTSVGSLTLFGRKRRLYIKHHTGVAEPPENIIEQISVTFTNILATIPMDGYRYPTAQHIGSVDAQVTFVMNCTNIGASMVSDVYDSIETTALRFKQIPAGFTNLFIRNDFLQIFNINEFITNNISIDTIGGQPGRSRVVMTLTEAGVTSRTRFETPETLRQEFVSNSEEVDESIWRVLEHRLYVTKTKPNSRDRISTDLFRLRIVQSNDRRNQALQELLKQARDNYNEFLIKLHDEIFDSNFTDGTLAQEAFMELKQKQAGLPFVPGLEKLQKSIIDRNILFRRANRHKEIRGVEQTASKKISDQAKNLRGVQRLQGGDDPRIKQKQGILFKRRALLNKMGLDVYINKQRRLFGEIQDKHLDLNEFAAIEEQTKKLGLDKGLMAYPDLRPQMVSVAGVGRETTVVSEPELMRYEPDCYFYYPAFNGGAKSSLFDGIIDPYYVSAAKLHSRQIYDNAQKDVGEFFSTTYANALFNSAWAGARGQTFGGPAKILADTLNDQGNRIVEPLYKGIIMNNALKNSSGTSQGIKKNVVPDPVAKIHSNWYPEPSPMLSTDSFCAQSTNINDLWDGVSQSIGNPAAQHGSPEESRLDSPEGVDPKATQKLASRNVVRSEALNFRWPIDPPSRSISKGQKFGAPRPYRGKVSAGIHKGLDMPEKARAKGRPKGINDGIYGMPVYAAESGSVWVVKNNGRIGGWWIRIGHRKGWTTSYWHLDPSSILVKRGQRVSKGQIIARIGRSGNRNSTTHLHFQTKLKGQYVDPETVLPGKNRGNIRRYTPPPRAASKIARLSSQSLARDATTTAVSPLALAIKEFEKDMLLGQAQSMNRAYPTFKLYFLEDDSKERKRLAFDDFFSYNAVKSIRVIRSRKIAADLCELYLTNISGTLSNRKFRQEKDGGRAARNDKRGGVREKAAHAGTRKENPIASLLLQEGINIQVRLGYSSDPDFLSTVFNGVITEVQFSESEDLVRVLAQSHAIELVQDIKGVQKPKESSDSAIFGWSKFWGFANDATTGAILENMMAEPEVLHFGRWEPTRKRANPVRDLLTQRWTFVPQPQDDNIFPPNPDDEIGMLDPSITIQNLKYIVYRTTIWDIFKEMELRHPNFISSPVPYEDEGRNPRMTMFYGLPNQLYFSRAPRGEELKVDQKLKKIIEEGAKKVASKLQPGVFVKRFIKPLDRLEKAAADASVVDPVGSFIGANMARFLKGELGGRAADAVGGAITNVITKPLQIERLNNAKIAGYVEPFRNYHLVTSSQHIIANNIRTNSRDVANTIVIKYGKNVEIDYDRTAGRDSSGVAIKGIEESFTLKLDSALPTEDVRTQMGQFLNVTNEVLAKRYALGLLLRNTKEVYKGELIILGNAKIKPYDVMYIFDEYSDMVGPIEVEEVCHVFDQQSGFRTEIKPDMLVQAAEWSLLSSAEALGVVMEGALKKFFGTDGPGHTASNADINYAGMLGHGLSFFGGFIANKIINYTQLAQPVIMAPLMHHGRIFAGGVPTRKIQTSVWTTVFGKWSAEADAGYYSWISDFWEVKMNWIRKGAGRFAVGNFFNNGGDSPI
jgi:hypothetical protein